ncbi:protein of unknown function [Xenorhabdus doucetiae]|uniref:Uncharacterized protein n=1 Tax=Xenorhabdus doucetiae TaxID=351671 RepID=A0A068QUZ8_9GAMM|nr:protein of unknown function [Xenorhabdus doucetiae]
MPARRYPPENLFVPLNCTPCAFTSECLVLPEFVAVYMIYTNCAQLFTLTITNWCIGCIVDVQLKDNYTPYFYL